MTTAGKLWFGFGTLTALLVLSVVAILVRVASVEGQVGGMAHARDLSAAARQLEINVLGYALNVRAYHQINEPQGRQDALAEIARVDRHLGEYQRLATTDRQRELAARCAASWQQLKEFGQALLDAEQPILTAEDSKRLYGLRVGLETLLDEEIQRDALMTYHAREDAALHDVRTLDGFALVLLLVGALLALATSFVVGRAVVRGERSIAEQGERLRTTLTSIGDAVISTDVTGRITNLNATAESLTGWRAAEAMGRPLDSVFRIVSEATRQPVEDPATKALREGVVVGLANHTVLIAKDGTERAIDDSAAPIRCKDGEIVGCVLVFRDITPKRRTELLQAEQARLLRLGAEVGTALTVGGDLQEVLQCCAESLVSNLDAAFARIWTLNDTQDVLELRASAGLYTHLDGPHGRVPVGSFKIGLIAQERKPHLTNAVIGDPRVPEQEWARREGMVAFAGYPLLVENRVIGVMAIFARHALSAVTLEAMESVASEIALGIQHRQAEAAVRQSDARKTAMFETTLDCIISINHEGTITEFNAAAERTFGHRREDVIGREMASVIIPPAYRKRHRHGMAHYLATGEGPILNQRLELSALRADGTEFPVELTVTRIPVDGPPVFTAYLRDITERKQMLDKLRETSEELRKYVADLSESGRRKNEFLAMLAHELRNPLAPIRNAMQVLRRSAGDGQPGGQPSSPVFEIMDRQVDHMVRLVDDLLDVSRISRGKIALRRGRVELGAIVHHAVEAARPNMSCADHELTVTVPPEPIYLQADPTRLTQVVGNLLNNACKFTDKGGRIELVVSVEGAVASGEWRVVSENKTGNSDNDRAALAPAQGVAAVDGHGGGVLPRDEEIPEGGTVRADQSDSTSGGVHPGQHRGGARASAHPGVSELPEHGTRIPDGVRNPSATQSTGGLSRSNATEPVAGDVGGNQPHTLGSAESAGSQALNLATHHSPLATSSVVIRVRDTGIGIAPDHLPRIFDMFMQADTALERTTSGLGIGLALVKNLVEMHGGTVEAHSAGLGQGSEFVVRLPVMNDEWRVTSGEKPSGEKQSGEWPVASGEQDKDGGAAVGAPSSLATNHSPLTTQRPPLATSRRILVVDDNRDSAVSLAMLLELTGNQTQMAHDGLAAVEAAAAFRPDVVLLDIGLPKLNGYEAARELRARPWGKNLMLIALTGWGQQEDRQKSADAGFDAHLVKPVDYDALMKLLAQKKAAV